MPKIMLKIMLVLLSRIQKKLNKLIARTYFCELVLNHQIHEVQHLTYMHIKHSDHSDIQPQILYMLTIFHLHYTSHRANFSFHAHFPLWNKNPSTPFFLFCRIYPIFSLLLLILRRPKILCTTNFAPPFTGAMV